MNRPKKIALLGLDCAITHLVRKHVDEGICPTFAMLMEQGVVAENCFVPYPTLTPPNWTSMATGAWPGTNGLTDFWRHIPGTVPVNSNSHNAFNWDYIRSESFWEAAEKIGKRSIIFNYPGGYNVHKKLKNATVVGGAGVVTGVFMDQNLVAEMTGRGIDTGNWNSFAFDDDVLISTDTYPGNSIRISYEKAEGWTNLDEPGDDPLEAVFAMPFAGSVFHTANATWYVLVRDMAGDGYDTLTLSPSKNFRDAFFTVKTGDWSRAFDADGILADGSRKVLRMKAKLLTMEDDAENMRLYLTHGLNKDGETWCFPQETASKLNRGDNVTTNNVGMFSLSLGWIGLEEFMELIEIHYDWLGDSVEALLEDGNWDIFYSHAHPTDYIYHVLMTELDPATCSSKEAHDKAWECHARLFKACDRYLARLMKHMDDDTLVTIISDHGATPDGTKVDMNDVLESAGLAEFVDTEPPAFVKTLPPHMQLNWQHTKRKMVPGRTQAMAQRTCYVYVNLRGRDPSGIVDPADYEKVQRKIVDALMTYRHPVTGERPFALALPKKDARLMGQWGEQCGDVVYALRPDFGGQHGSMLPTAEFGVGNLKPLCMFYGPKLGIKQGYSMERMCNLIDLVPTYCYMTGWPLPKQAEGAVIYQIMEDPDQR